MPKGKLTEFYQAGEEKVLELEDKIYS